MNFWAETSVIRWSTNSSFQYQVLSDTEASSQNSHLGCRRTVDITWECGIDGETDVDWNLYPLTLADLERVRGTRTPSVQFFFIFTQFSAKMMPNNRLAPPRVGTPPEKSTIHYWSIGFVLLRSVKQCWCISLVVGNALAKKADHVFAHYSVFRQLIHYNF